MEANNPKLDYLSATYVQNPLIPSVTAVYIPTTQPQITNNSIIERNNRDNQIPGNPGIFTKLKRNYRIDSSCTYKIQDITIARKMLKPDQSLN